MQTVDSFKIMLTIGHSITQAKSTTHKYWPRTPYAIRTISTHMWIIKLTNLLFNSNEKTMPIPKPAPVNIQILQIHFWFCLFKDRSEVQTLGCKIYHAKLSSVKARKLFVLYNWRGNFHPKICNNYAAV